MRTRRNSSSPSHRGANLARPGNRPNVFDGPLRRACLLNVELGRPTHAQVGKGGVLWDHGRNSRRSSRRWCVARASRSAARSLTRKKQKEPLKQAKHSRQTTKTTSTSNRAATMPNADCVPSIATGIVEVTAGVTAIATTFATTACAAISAATANGADDEATGGTDVMAGATRIAVANDVSISASTCAEIHAGVTGRFEAWGEARSRNRC